MAFGFSNRKRAYYITIVCFFVILFIIYSWRRAPDSILLEIEDVPLETTTEFTFYKNNSNTKLFDLNFKYVLSPNSCPKNEDILAVIIVTSHYNNVETRSAMRRSFSQNDLKKLNMRRFFLLGQTSDNIYITQASIFHESKRFDDIIQGSFLEAYRNLTYKHVMGLKWVSENCVSAKYVIKMDDDIVFNVKKTTKLLKTIHFPENFIAGYILRDMKAIREPANKWYVTKQEYRFSKYPAFVSGWFYVTTPETATKLVLLSHYFKYFWVDDVFVTGILAKSLKVRQFDLRQYFTVFSEFLQCCITDVKKYLECNVLIGPNGGDNNLFFDFNKAMQNCEVNSCKKRIKPLNETCVAERKVNLKGGNGIIENYKLH